MSRKSKPVTIPIENDLAVYARAVSDFYACRSQLHYSIVVLAQRVLLERARVSKKAGRMAEINDMIKRVNTDPAYRAVLIGGLDGGSPLVSVYPHYADAGFIQK